MKAGGSPRAVDRYGFLDEPQGRTLRGERILAAFEDFAGVDVTTARMLDIGCSAGLMTEALAARGATVIGVDVDTVALHHADARGEHAAFAAAAGERLPFRDGCFDAVVCNHVYEHVRDPHALLREAHRVLRRDGACYFAGGHTLQLIEPHHRLPLLSWLPRGIASAWLRALGREADYDERFVAPWKLRSLLAPFGEIRFISPRMLREPERYGFPQLAHWPARAALRFGAGIVARLAPTWIYMLRKT